MTVALTVSFKLISYYHLYYFRSITETTLEFPERKLGHVL